MTDDHRLDFQSQAVIAMSATEYFRIRLQLHTVTAMSANETEDQIQLTITDQIKTDSEIMGTTDKI